MVEAILGKALSQRAILSFENVGKGCGMAAHVEWRRGCGAARLVRCASARCRPARALQSARAGWWRWRPARRARSAHVCSPSGPRSSAGARHA